MFSKFSVALLALGLALLTGAKAGVYKVNVSSYRLEAKLDRQVLSSDVTEIWAEVYYPKAIKTSKKIFPLVIFLHGNHATCGRLLADGIRRDDDCSYTFSGVCSRPSNIVVPNHEGYRYVGKPLASFGYVVVSINANRGINCNGGGRKDSGLNLARGRLVLRHLALLSKWNKVGGAPSSIGFDVKGKLDFDNIGLMGHSRGGEGVRAALAQSTELPWVNLISSLRIRAIFEVGPVDGQTSRVLNTQGVASVILLPSCDGDVSNLQGMKVFDRVFIVEDRNSTVPKGTITVIGANHNFYNTEWQESDSSSCDGASFLRWQKGGSRLQRLTLLRTLVPFMRAYVGSSSNEKLGTIFDPAYAVSPDLDKITFYERNHLRNPPGKDVQILEAFSKPQASQAGIKHTFAGVTYNRVSPFEQDPSVQAADISWTTQANSTQFWQLNIARNPGLDFLAIKTFSFRVAALCAGRICSMNINESPDVDFSISLLDAKGKLSASVSLKSVAEIRRPVAFHSLLQTVDVPISRFPSRSFDISSVVAIRFTFDKIKAGEIYLADFTTDTAGTKALPMVLNQRTSMPVRRLISHGTPSRSVQRRSFIAERVAGSNKLIRIDMSDGEDVMVVLSSVERFPITDSFPVMVVGNSRFENGLVKTDENQIIFRIPRESFGSLLGEVRVLIGKDWVWEFGAWEDLARA